MTEEPIALQDNSTAAAEPLRAGPVSRWKQIASNLSFVLFVLLNAVLFIQPTDAFEHLKNWPIYEVLILACLAISLWPVIRQLSLSSLRENPITVCVLGLLVAAIASHLSHGRIPLAVTSGVEIAKLVIYYLLLVAVIDTPRRLRWFLAAVTVCACVQIGMAVLEHHHVIDLVSLRPAAEQEYRTRGAGIFQDPNHLGVLAATTICLCLYELILTARAMGSARWVRLVSWLFALSLCVHGLMLTQSRGAYVALVAGLGMIGLTRFGWKKSLIAAVILIPLIRLSIAGRQTDINIRRTTAQSRLAFWDQGLTLFVQSPVFGIGQDEFRGAVGNVAHNSFVQCFTEMGFFGGTLFLGAFCLAIWAIFRVRGGGSEADDSRKNSVLLQARPYLLAVIVAWVTGMLTLSRSYVPPTYAMLGLATAYLALVTREQSLPRLRFNGPLAASLAGLSVAFLMGVYLFVRVFLRA